MDYLIPINSDEIAEGAGARGQQEKTLYTFGIEAPLPSQLFRRLAETPIVLHGFNDVGAMLRASADRPADILLLDPKRLSGGLTPADLLTHMEKRSGIRPVMFCLSSTTDIRARVQALRDGAAAVFPIPADVADIVTKLKEIIAAEEPDQYRVLVVDEHKFHSKLLSDFLESAGMQTAIVGDSLKVMDTIESFSPDLLLMDLAMPEIRGDELASLIRNSGKYNDIPIVFVSGEENAGNQLHALSVCGDEFLVKPVERQRLVATVKQHIERVRSIRAGLEREDASRMTVSPVYPHRFLVRLERAINDDCLTPTGSGLFYIRISTLRRHIESHDNISIDSIRASVGALILKHLNLGDFAERIDAFDYAIYGNRTNETALRESAEDLLNALNNHTVEIEKKRVEIKAAIGIGFVRPIGDDALALISRADNACTQAARVGGGRVEAHVSLIADPPSDVMPNPEEPSLQQGLPKDERIAVLIRAALDADDFQLFYQPILALQESGSLRHDVQLRMKTPDGELISPLEFLPVARRLGWMEEIDRWVMDNALKTLQEQQGVGRKFRFFIHQSAASLQAKDWVPWLREQIVRRDLIKSRPVIQFLSDDILDNQGLALERFRDLERLGIPVCLINMTGDMEQLKLFERPSVKMIAKLAVSHVSNSETWALRSFVREVHSRNARVFATGIEDSLTIGRAWNCGFDFIQGNFIQFPHPDPAFEVPALTLGQ